MLSRWPTIPFGIVPSAPTATLVLNFHSFPNSLARSWYLAIFSFSFCSTLASPGTAMLIIWQTACCLSTTTRSGLLWSSWGSVYMLKSQRIFTFSDSQASRDMLIPLVSNFQFVLTAQASMDTFCNTNMSNFIFSLSQCWAFPSMWLIDSWALLHNLHFELAACLSIFACYCIGSKCLVLRRC